MKKLYIVLLLLIAGAVQGFAQDKGGQDRGKMIKEVQEFRMKYIAQEIDLKDDQKAKFFELYSDMSKKRRECFKKVRDLENKLKKSGDAASEVEYQQMMESLTKAKAEAAEIEKTYDEKFSDFLSQKQIYKMKEAEKEFNKRAESMVEDRKKNQKGRPKTR